MLRKVLHRDVEVAGDLIELLGDGTADHQPLDLVGTLVDLRDLGVAHVLFDRIVLAVAVAAEQLHGVFIAVSDANTLAMAAILFGLGTPASMARAAV